MLIKVFIFFMSCLLISNILTDQQEFKQSENHTQRIIVEISNASLMFPYVKETYKSIDTNIMVNNRPKNSTVYILPDGELDFLCPQDVICEIDNNVKGMTEEIMQDFTVKMTILNEEIGKKVLEQYKPITSQPRKEELEIIRQGSYNLFGLKFNTYIAKHTFFSASYIIFPPVILLIILPIQL